MSKWTKEEINILKDIYEVKNKNEIITLILKHTWYAIIWKARELGLKYDRYNTVKLFFAKVNKNSGIYGKDSQYPTECWIWKAFLDKDGYGGFQAKGKAVRAHRFSYEFYIGPIPNNLTIDHLCKNPSCVRPDHLEPVTNRENIMRGEGVAAKNSKKTHCKHGHEFSLENTHINTSGKRYCRMCAKLRARKIINYQGNPYGKAKP